MIKIFRQSPEMDIFSGHPTASYHEMSTRHLTVGVLALQGAFSEHLHLLRQASKILATKSLEHDTDWTFLEVRTPEQLARCDALIIPGGESTTMSLVATRSGLLEPLRDFVKYGRPSPPYRTLVTLLRTTRFQSP